jgi:hypothetical protein
MLALSCAQFCERGSLERAMRLGKFKRTGRELSELVSTAQYIMQQHMSHFLWWLRSLHFCLKAVSAVLLSHQQQLARAVPEHLGSILAGWHLQGTA